MAKLTEDSQYSPRLSDEGSTDIVTTKSSRAPGLEQTVAAPLPWKREAQWPSSRLESTFGGVAALDGLEELNGRAHSGR